MANRLNVLVGAELASDVTKKLNEAIQNCPLEEIDVKLGLDKDSKKRLIQDVGAALDEILSKTDKIDISKKLPSGFKGAIQKVLSDALGITSEKIEKDLKSVVDNVVKTAKAGAQAVVDAENTKQEAIKKTYETEEQLAKKQEAREKASKLNAEKNVIKEQISKTKKKYDKDRINDRIDQFLEKAKQENRSLPLEDGTKTDGFQEEHIEEYRRYFQNKYERQKKEEISAFKKAQNELNKEIEKLQKEFGEDIISVDIANNKATDNFVKNEEKKQKSLAVTEDLLDHIRNQITAQEKTILNESARIEQFDFEIDKVQRRNLKQNAKRQTDALLKTGKITQEEYDEKLKEMLKAEKDKQAGQIQELEKTRENALAVQKINKMKLDMLKSDEAAMSGQKTELEYTNKMKEVSRKRYDKSMEIMLAEAALAEQNLSDEQREIYQRKIDSNKKKIESYDKRLLDPEAFVPNIERAEIAEDSGEKEQAAAKQTADVVVNAEERKQEAVKETNAIVQQITSKPVDLTGIEYDEKALNREINKEMASLYDVSALAKAKDKVKELEKEVKTTEAYMNRLSRQTDEDLEQFPDGDSRKRRRDMELRLHQNQLKSSQQQLESAKAELEIQEQLRDQAKAKATEIAKQRLYDEEMAKRSSAGIVEAKTEEAKVVEQTAKQVVKAEEQKQEAIKETEALVEKTDTEQSQVVEKVEEVKESKGPVADYQAITEEVRAAEAELAALKEEVAQQKQLRDNLINEQKEEAKASEKATEQVVAAEEKKQEAVEEAVKQIVASEDKKQQVIEETASKQEEATAAITNEQAAVKEAEQVIVKAEEKKQEVVEQAAEQVVAVEEKQQEAIAETAKQTVEAEEKKQEAVKETVVEEEKAQAVIEEEKAVAKETEQAVVKSEEQKQEAVKETAKEVVASENKKQDAVEETVLEQKQVQEVIAKEEVAVKEVAEQVVASEKTKQDVVEETAKQVVVSEEKKQSSIEESLAKQKEEQEAIKERTRQFVEAEEQKQRAIEATTKQFVEAEEQKQTVVKETTRKVIEAEEQKQAVARETTQVVISAEEQKQAATKETTVQVVISEEQKQAVTKETTQVVINSEEQKQDAAKETTQQVIAFEDKKQSAIIDTVAEQKQVQEELKDEKAAVADSAKEFVKAEEKKQNAINDTANAVRTYSVYKKANDDEDYETTRESVRIDKKDGTVEEINVYYHKDKEGNEHEKFYQKNIDKTEEFAYRQAEKRAVAQEKLEEKRQLKMKKTLEVAREVEIELRKIYDNSVNYDNAVYGYEQDRQLQSFEAELADIYSVLQKDNVQVYELIDAINRLGNLKIDSKNFVGDINSSQRAYEAQIQERIRLESEVYNQRQKELEEAFDADDRRQDRAIALEEKRLNKRNAAQNQYKKTLKQVNKLEQIDASYLSDEDVAKLIDFSKTYRNELQKELDIINNQTSETYELIGATRRLAELQSRANDVFGDFSGQSKIQSILTAFNQQTERDVVSLKSRYGSAFDENQYRRIRDLQSEINNIIREQGYNEESVNDAVRRLNSNTRTFTNNLRASAKELKDIREKADLLDSSLGRFIQFYGFGELFRGLKMAFTSVATNIKEIDTSMLELKKVGEETDYVYNKFLDDAADKAKDLGTSLKDYIDSVTEFARMGYDFKESQIIAETANIMQMVSEGLTGEESAQYLISIMAAYGIEAERTMEIIDQLNNVDRRSRLEISGQTLSFYRETSRSGRPIPRIRLFYVMCA